MYYSIPKASLEIDIFCPLADENPLNSISSHFSWLREIFSARGSSFKKQEEEVGWPSIECCEEDGWAWSRETSNKCWAFSRIEIIKYVFEDLLIKIIFN